MSYVLTIRQCDLDFVERMSSSLLFTTNFLGHCFLTDINEQQDSQLLIP